MKLSKTTINLLRNFAGINTNLLIRPGNEIMTVAANKTAFAKAEVEETFDVEFGVYDLSELLGVLSIFESPELEFTDRSLTISSGKNRVRYMPADASVLISPKKEPKFTDSPEAEFTLTSQQLSQIIKASSVLKVPFMTINGDGEKISVLIHDKSNPNTNQFAIDVESVSSSKFDLHIKVESLKMIPEDYQVLVSSSKMCKFIGDKKSYIVTGETDSSFE